LGLFARRLLKLRHVGCDSRVEEDVMRETTLFWGILAASLANVLCLCAYIESCRSLVG